MIKDIITKIRSTFADPEEVAAYRYTIPSRINISFKKDKEFIIAYINDVDGDTIDGLLITQGKDTQELITNINQLVYNYIKMPEYVRPFYGNMFNPPIGSKLKTSGKLVLERA